MTAITEAKDIRFSNGKIKEMTYDEVLKQFSNMLDKFAYGIVANSLYNEIAEREDVKQELSIQVWKAFKEYNIDEKTAFSTFLHHKLMSGRSKIIARLTAQKRTNENGTISMNSTVLDDGGESELENVLGFDDDNIVALEFNDFIKELNQSLTKPERLCLRVLMDKTSFSVNELSVELGISRQAANKRVNIFREKMKSILINSGYLENKRPDLLRNV